MPRDVREGFRVYGGTSNRSMHNIPTQTGEEVVQADLLLLEFCPTHFHGKFKQKKCPDLPRIPKNLAKKWTTTSPLPIVGKQFSGRFIPLRSQALGPGPGWHRRAEWRPSPTESINFDPQAKPFPTPPPHEGVTSSGLYIFRGHMFLVFISPPSLKFINPPTSPHRLIQHIPLPTPPGPLRPSPLLCRPVPPFPAPPTAAKIVRAPCAPPPLFSLFKASSRHRKVRYERCAQRSQISPTIG